MDGTKIVYKVGDYVVVSEHLDTIDRYFKSDTLCKCVGNNYYSPLDKNAITGCWKGIRDFSITQINSERKVRPATQEEINKVNEEEKIMIGEYEVDFGNARGDQLDFIKIGCVKVNKELYIETGKKAGWL